MLKISLVMIVTSFLSAVFSSCQSPQKNFETINVEEFADYIQDKNVQCLDVRTLAEYSEGHIPQSININVMDDSFVVMVDSLLQQSKPVALYCRSGKRSKKAAQLLSEKGYKVVELDKGFNAWQEAEKQIER